jgi:two-component system sensor histidine kinase DesK
VAGRRPGRGVAATVVAFVRWAAGDVLRVALPCVAVTAAVWPFSVLVADGGAGFVGICCVGAFAIPQLSRHRRVAVVALPVYVAAVGATRLLMPY